MENVSILVISIIRKKLKNLPQITNNGAKCIPKKNNSVNVSFAILSG